MTAKTFAIIIAWNDREFLPELLATLTPVAREDFQVLFVDNGSDDHPETIIRAHFPHVTILRNSRHLPFAQAFNQAMRYVFSGWQGEDLSERSILLVSPALRLAPKCVDELQKSLDAHPEAGSTCGIILRAFRDPAAEDPLADAIKSDVIENAGILMRKNRRFVLRGTGEIDRGQFAAEPAPFGGPASLALYRASALQKILCDERVVDVDVQAGSAMLDVAWRLQVAGFGTVFSSDAKAYRFCGVQSASNMAAISAKPIPVSPHDMWELMLKNESVSGIFFLLPGLFFSWLLHLWSPTSTVAPFAALGRLPAILKKRRQVQATRAVKSV